jgi:hypothetical protein
MGFLLEIGLLPKLSEASDRFVTRPVLPKAGHESMLCQYSVR